MKHTLILLAAGLLLLGACKKDEAPAPTGGGTPAPAAVTMTDVDGNTYATVLIEGARWTKVNLRTTHYSNGDPIVDDLEVGDVTGSGAYGEVNGTENNALLYGRLYNVNAVRDSRGLCPSGWHLSTDADWLALETFLGMPTAELGILGMRGGTQSVGGKLKAQTQWNSPNTGATDQVGFKALPAGRYIAGFELFGIWGIFWTSTQDSQSSFQYYRQLTNSNAGIGRNIGSLGFAFSCRCVQD